MAGRRTDNNDAKDIVQHSCSTSKQSHNTQF